MNSTLVRIATTTVAALTLIMVEASPVQAAGLTNCNDPGATTPCFEKVWSDGAQVKMTFVDLNPTPSNAPTRNFYVLAPQTGAPQGRVPFLHDHVIGDVSPQTHGDDRGNNPVRYHGYFVLCSDQGISSGGCVPTMTSVPGLGTMPFAKTVNGHKLTSADPIESPANSRLLTVFDTGGRVHRDNQAPARRRIPITRHCPFEGTKMWETGAASPVFLFRRIVFDVGVFAGGLAGSSPILFSDTRDEGVNRSLAPGG